MHIERRLTADDDGGFELLDALLDGPFALCALLVDEEGRPADYRFLRVSRCFEEMTGFHGVEGRTVRELVPGVEAKWIELYGEVALARRPARFREASGVTGREYDVRAAPLDPPGHFVMAFTDLTELRRLEAEREAALAHAQHLLKELGHRVMNSFAAISAILAMEARALPRESRPAMERVQGRVQALAALYRRLDGAPEADRIAAAEYLGGVVAAFRDSLAAASGVRVEAELSPIMLPTGAAVPLALVTNELLTNAVKHAFGTSGRGLVRVTLREEEGRCRLTVSDDGTGLGDGPEGSGRGLVTAFAAELGGEVETRTGPDGTWVSVAFRP